MFISLKVFLIVCSGIWNFASNMPLQYVSSMNCILTLILGFIDGFDWEGSPLTHRRFDLNLALQ